VKVEILGVSYDVGEKPHKYAKLNIHLSVNTHLHAEKILRLLAGYECIYKYPEDVIVFCEEARGYIVEVRKKYESVKEILSLEGYKHLKFAVKDEEIVEVTNDTISLPIKFKNLAEKLIQGLKCPFILAWCFPKVVTYEGQECKTAAKGRLLK